MKIRIQQLFRHQASATKVRKYPPGVYDVPRQMSNHVAELALKFGRAEIVAPVMVEKKAPEDKVVGTPENKARVVKQPVRRRSTRTKPDA